MKFRELGYGPTRPATARDWLPLKKAHSGCECKHAFSWGGATSPLVMTLCSGRFAGPPGERVVARIDVGRPSCGASRSRHPSLEATARMGGRRGPSGDVMRVVPRDGGDGASFHGHLIITIARSARSVQWIRGEDTVFDQPRCVSRRRPDPTPWNRARFPLGTVRLRRVPARSPEYRAAWKGACDGSGPVLQGQPGRPVDDSTKDCRAGRSPGRRERS
jgi:hypothetical protein